MLSDADLISRARAALSPRKPTPMVEVGHVAAALVTDKDNVYVGVCLETACSLGFCAEHSAVAAMILGGETRITRIVAVRRDGDVIPSCGRCRELMWQIDFGNADTVVLLGEGESISLRELLPLHWKRPAS